jgi:hypothetical protein
MRTFWKQCGIATNVAVGKLARSPPLFPLADGFVVCQIYSKCIAAVDVNIGDCAALLKV